MVSSGNLAPILESLCDQRIRPWNVATIAASALLRDLFADRGDLINEIALIPEESGQGLSLDSLRIYPTGWADLILLDADGVVGIQPDQLWAQLVRVAAKQGLMVVLGSAEADAGLNPFAADQLPLGMVGYVLTSGTEACPGTNRNLYWARRNTRVYASAGIATEGLDKVTQQLRTLTNTIDHLSQSLPASAGDSSLSGNMSGPQNSSDIPDHSHARGVHVNDLEAMIASLQRQLEDRNQTCRAAERALSDLKRRYTSVRLALAGGGSPIPSEAQEETSPDELVVEILSLRRQLAEMTASYLEMRDNVHALVNSGFWRITWLPRRLLDRLRASLNTSRRVLPAQLPQALRLLKSQLVDVLVLSSSASTVPSPAAENQTAESLALPAAVQPSPRVDSAEADGDQLASFERDPDFWQQLWTGTFLNLHDNSTTASQNRRDRILFVDWRLPEPDQDSGSCRIFAILEIAISLGLRVDFISDADNQSDKYRDALLDLGIHVIEGRMKGWQHLQRFGIHYRQCFVCRPEPASFYFPLIRCYCPEAQLIYDTVDLHYSRFHRGSQLSGLEKGERALQLRLHHHYKSAETLLVKSADCIAVVTELEKQEVISSIAPTAPVIVLPNIHSLPERSSLPGWAERKDILFVGSFDHAPNLDAVGFFCEQILPLVLTELPDLTFHIVGSNMPDKIRSLKGINVNPIGYVEDLRHVFDRVRVFVAPLRYGAGLKGKVGQSMSYGVPVVGTSIAFEGFGILDQQHGMIADHPQEFAKALVMSYLDPDLWLSLSTQAWSLIDAKFSTQAIRKSLESLLQIGPS